MKKLNRKEITSKTIYRWKPILKVFKALDIDGRKVKIKIKIVV